MGGSGSNLVGYECKGTFMVDGHRYSEAIPGNELHPPGTTLRCVTVPGDPALLSTVRAVASEHASWRVFILPTVLLVILLLLVGALALRRRHISRASP
jgi:MYXO-CTERM domain-containing protein